MLLVALPLALAAAMPVAFASGGHGHQAIAQATSAGSADCNGANGAGSGAGHLALRPAFATGRESGLLRPLFSVDLVGRTVAPDGGVDFERKFEGSADLARDDGESVDAAFFLTGVRPRF
ncbi:Copper resistance protein B precursor (CopB) [Tistlia consotensis]|uniref:Copper resistance protein B (CopB) n=1 Tax=Tistlia consotensis USBA 355 TaxID=560819 RepID=A0A1Y6BST1_9PROT|nr:copper resistance protein B [Tistlia consotensis]SMF27365.1 Copper resistance protein B precursor (CopB) [Tistlia consotensis USBA 355]SNR66125.1 Copper resistance protein B precursor (CopB) [Tistlia consotensis]